MATFPGMMDAILEVLVEGSSLSRGAACSALVECTFRNADNALLVAKKKGMMHGVVLVMQTSTGDVRDDAAGVLRNCSNYSQAAAEVIVQTPGVLDALIEMCKGENSERFTAMGTIQNLTRCKSVAPLLCKTRVVAEALLPALDARGSGEDHNNVDVDVLRAEALMGITNLSTLPQLQCLKARPDISKVIVQMLCSAVRGQAWKDVAWYDADECLRPLAQMTLNPANHAVLRSAGLVHVLVDLLCFWLEEQAYKQPASVHNEAHTREHPSLPRVSRLDSTAAMSDRFSEAGEDIVENVEAHISIGHQRLQHALCVCEVLNDGRSSFDGDDTWCNEQLEAPQQPSSWCMGERNDSDRAVPREIDMATLALVKLSESEECALTMRRLALSAVLHAVTVFADCMTQAPVLHSWTKARTMEPRHLAVGMGHHARLGGNSWLMRLDAPVLWLIMQSASSMCGAARSLAAELDQQSSLEVAAPLLGILLPLTIPFLSAPSPPLQDSSKQELYDDLYAEAGADIASVHAVHADSKHLGSSSPLM